MSRTQRAVLVVALFAVQSLQASDVLTSLYAPADHLLNADPDSVTWHEAPRVVAANDINGEAVPENRTEIRSRWTEANLYLLFVCHFAALYLKPNPKTGSETNQLWNWDVAEAFIGDDFKNIKRYKEFEVSPQGEWVDLDIDLSGHKEHPEAWNSGFHVKARIDEASHTWYAEMQIPFPSIHAQRAVAGQELRINLFRCEGALPYRKLLAWQPPRSKTFHQPEAFGLLRLAR